MVELRRRLIVLSAPALAGVERDRHAAVVRVGEIPGILRVDPEVVIVAVRGRQRREPYSSINRLHDRRVHHVDDVGVLRVGGDVHVVPRARLDETVLAQQPPCLPRVVGSEEPALFRFDDRVHAIRICRRDGHADLAHQLWQPFGESRPAVATVGRLPDAAPGPSAAHQPRKALVIPERRIEDTRIGGIHRQIACTARWCGALQHEGPVLSAICCTVDTPLGSALPTVALHGDVHDVGVRRMHAHLRDLLGQLQPDAREALAGVGALEHSVAVRRRLAAHRVLPRPDIHDVRIRLGDGDRPDRSVHPCATRPVGDVPPRVAGILRLPHATTRITGVVDVRLRRDPRRSNRPPATGGPNVAPLHRAEKAGVVGGCRPLLRRESCWQRGEDGEGNTRGSVQSHRDFLDGEVVSESTAILLAPRRLHTHRPAAGRQEYLSSGMAFASAMIFACTVSRSAIY